MFVRMNSAYGTPDAFENHAEQRVPSVVVAPLRTRGELERRVLDQIDHLRRRQILAPQCRPLWIVRIVFERRKRSCRPRPQANAEGLSAQRAWETKGAPRQRVKESEPGPESNRLRRSVG